MAIGAPYIPENITVHLGKPQENARNVTVPFPDYIKNVASSEIYPTWPEEAIRANILAQISFALNRVYTEWYRSQGYPFDITNSTQYDQYYVEGREIFENISRIVDDIFNNYIVKQGSVEPYFAEYCDGKTVSCDGLSQWGTVDLAGQGYTPYRILQYYYGDNIGIVENAPIRPYIESYPGFPLRVGSAGNEVKTAQVELNRIGQNYPAIPRISSPDGFFGVETERAVKEFQRIFNLEQDGIIGKATWYKLKYIYASVKRLAQLTSEGLSLPEVEPPFLTSLKPGSRGNEVRFIQYYLNVVSYFNPEIPTIAVDGIYGPQTEEAVRAFQRYYGLTEDGIVGRNTWVRLNAVYNDLIKSLPPGYQGQGAAIYPGYHLKQGATGEDVRNLQTYLNRISDNNPDLPSLAVDGDFGPATTATVRAFQQQNNLPVTGVVGPITWERIRQQYDELV